MFRNGSFLVHDLYMTCSWLAHSLFTACSLLAHNLFMTCFWILCNFFTIWQLLNLNCSWLAHILFTICPWLIHDLFMSCWWHVHNLFIICSCIVHNLFMTYSLLVICSWLFIQIFCNFINSLELPHLHYFISFTSLNSNASLEMLYFIYLTWTTHFIQNTSFELLQVGHSSAPTCLSFLSQCFLQKGFSHHKTYFFKSNFAPPHQTLAISWSCYLLRWYFRKGHYSVSPLASSFIRNIHM